MVLLASSPTIGQMVNITAAERSRPVLLPDNPIPAIHGPACVGVSPQRPFLYLVPATGKAPLQYTAVGLPPGVALDKMSGIMHGQIPDAGAYRVLVTVSGSVGKTSRELTIHCGEHEIGLTPPMGWNSFNIYGNTVDDAKIRDAVETLITSGLTAHGYAYICLDDSWQGGRDAQGTLFPNARRFPALQGLGAYIHAHGLKFGLYTSATAYSSTGYVGSFGYEPQDAKEFAGWGVDYLKTDWSLPMAGDPPQSSDYQGTLTKMRQALDQSGRDVFYAIATNHKFDANGWAKMIGANSLYCSAGVRLDLWDDIRPANLAVK
jgi:alpha-galactosidase